MSNTKKYVTSKDMMTTDLDKTVEKEFVADAVALKALNERLLAIEQARNVTGVKGAAESSYRTGDVDLTLQNLGYEAVNNLTTETAGKLLDARQGKVLSTSIMSVSGLVDTLQSDIATAEPSSTSTHAYAVGDYLMYSSQLYKVTQAISVGDTLVAGTNIAATKIADNFGSGGGGGAVTGVKGNAETLYRTGNVNITPDNIGAVDTSKLGVANGVAELDSSGKVPSSQLPSNESPLSVVDGKLCITYRV